MMRRIIAVILILFSSFFLVSCKNEEINGTIKTTAVVVKAEDNLRSLLVGKTLQLEAVVYPETAPQTVVWESNNEDVATVDQSGLVRGLKTGRVKITAKTPYVSGYIYLGVYEDIIPTLSLTIAKQNIIYIDEYIKLDYQRYPQNSNQEIVWTSDNEEVAKVDHNGRVYASKAGTVNITAVSGSATDTASIQVQTRSGNPSKITLKGREILEAGSSMKLRVVTEPRGALNDVTYVSSDESIATVDEQGVVSGISAGKVTITATSKVNALQANIEIEVRDYRITLDNWTDAYKQVIAASKNSVFGVANYQYVLNTSGKYQLMKQSIGSGVIYKIWFELKDGSLIYDLDDLESFSDVSSYHYYLVTNKHVVIGSDALKVYLHDIDEEIPATLIQYDDKVDIAVVYFETDRYYRPLEFADVSNLESGEYVVAIGNPSGFEYSSSATHGIVSHPKRYIPDDTDGDGVNDWEPEYIQHDAAINPGNSGGPLLNLKGQIIGINTLKFASNEIDNMGFSIPSNIVVHLLGYLENNQVPTRATLGVSSYTVKDLLNNPDIGYDVPAGITYGLYVISVTPGSKAAEAGIQPHDIILSANSRELKNTIDIRSKLDEIIVGSGDKLVLEVYRNGEIIRFTLIY